MELCRRAFTAGDLPDKGGERPQVVVTVPLRGAARRDRRRDAGRRHRRSPPPRPAGWPATRRSSPPSSAAAAELLDLGRGRRLFTGAVRRALALRDRGCAFPGCDRPVGWCDAHHITGWANGGATTVDNGVLLCGHHHRLIERRHWEIIIAADGIPEFRPPPWTDPNQRPLRNHMHKRE